MQFLAGLADAAGARHREEVMQMMIVQPFHDPASLKENLGILVRLYPFLKAPSSPTVKSGSGGLMQVELRIRDTARRDVLRAHVERRLRFALSRFESGKSWCG